MEYPWQIFERFLTLIDLQLGQNDLVERPKVGSAPPLFPDDWLVDARQNATDCVGGRGSGRNSVDPQLLLEGTGERYRILFDSFCSGIKYLSKAASQYEELSPYAWPATAGHLESAVLGYLHGQTFRQVVELARGKFGPFRDEKAVEEHLRRALEKKLEPPPLRRWKDLTEWMRPLRPQEYHCLRGREKQLERFWELLESDCPPSVVALVGPAGVGRSSLLSAVVAEAIIGRRRRLIPCWLVSREKTNLEKELAWYLFYFGLRCPPLNTEDPNRTLVQQLLDDDFAQVLADAQAFSQRAVGNPGIKEKLLFLLDAGSESKSGTKNITDPAGGRRSATNKHGALDLEWLTPLWKLCEALGDAQILHVVVSFNGNARDDLPASLDCLPSVKKIGIPELQPKDLVKVFLDRVGTSTLAKKRAHQAVVHALAPDAPQGRLHSVLAMAHCCRREPESKQTTPWKDARDAMMLFAADLMVAKSLLGRA